MYAEGGRPSILPEKLLHGQLVQMLYSVRSERLLMEKIDYSILFRWFVALNLDEAAVGRDLVHEESRPAAGSRGGQGVFGPGCGTGAFSGTYFERAFHGGWHAAGSVGECEEFSAQGGEPLGAAGRPRQSDCGAKLSFSEVS